MKMVVSIKDNLVKIKFPALVFLNGLVVLNIKVIGIKENLMAKESTMDQKEMKLKENG
jgi:hypothetical protein